MSRSSASRSCGSGRSATDAEQLVPELAADRRARLRNVLRRRPQPVQPRHQRGVQRRGHRQRRMRHGGQGCRTLRAGFEHRLGQLLDEQRHAVGALGDLLHDLGRQRVIAGDVFDHRRGVAPVEPRQSEHRHMRLPGPGRLELGAERREQQHRPMRDPLDRAVQQFARARIDPVDVLEHHQHRLPLRQALDLPQQRLERLLLLALRRDIERRCDLGRAAASAARRSAPRLPSAARWRRAALAAWRALPPAHRRARSRPRVPSAR